MIVLVAALFMSLGLINLDFGRNWWRGQSFRLIVGFPLLLLYAYVEMPALVFPQAFTLLLVPFVPNAAYSVLIAARNAVAARRVVSIRRTPHWPYLIGLVAARGVRRHLGAGADRRCERLARRRRRTDLQYAPA